jgi:hypothetical protein
MEDDGREDGLCYLWARPKSINQSQQVLWGLCRDWVEVPDRTPLPTHPE